MFKVIIYVKMCFYEWIFIYMVLRKINNCIKFLLYDFSKNDYISKKLIYFVVCKFGYYGLGCS